MSSPKLFSDTQREGEREGERERDREREPQWINMCTTFDQVISLDAQTNLGNLYIFFLLSVKIRFQYVRYKHDCTLF